MSVLSVPFLLKVVIVTQHFLTSRLVPIPWAIFCNIKNLLTKEVQQGSNPNGYVLKYQKPSSKGIAASINVYIVGPASKLSLHAQKVILRRHMLPGGTSCGSW
jgi:hypothetical protein